MNILIVEDNDESRNMLESLLKGRGYDVISATNGVEAIERLKKERFDMIISDILMPKMDGFVLCRKCKSDDTLRKIPFVFYTATYTDKKDEEFALSLGAEKFIVKPVEPDKFLEILEAVIEEHEAGTLAAPKRPVEDETVYLAEYNKRLIEKLEHKALNLEKELAERKRAEKALRRERDKAQRYFDVAGVMLIAIDTEQRVGLINKKGCDILGYKEEEILGKNWFDNFLPSRIKDETKAVFEKLIRAEVDAPEYRENPILTKSGDERLMAWHNTVLRDEKGRIIATLSSGEDITERKQTEMEKDALRKNLESLWGLAQLAEHDMKTLCDYVLKQIAERTASPYVSYGFLSEDESEYLVYSWSPDVMEDCKMQDKPRIFPVEKAGLWAEAIRNRAPIIINDYQKAHPGKKGLPEGHVPLTRLMVVPVFSQGRITAMAAVANKKAEYQEEDIKQLSAFITSAQTIIDRKKAEEALRESEEHYRMLAETMNDGLEVIDEKGKYVYVNNKFGEIMGYSPDEIVGGHWTAFFDEDAQKIIHEQLIERKKGVAKPYELINTRKDGQKIFLHISPQAIFDEDGKFKGSFAIFTDITERKKTEEQIAKLAKFPAEDPNPVLRISGRGTVVYANTASANLLKTWCCSVGKSLPDRWNEFVMDSLSSGQSQQTEVKCDGRIFSLTFAPVVDANYVNVYGHDITERKKAEEDIRNLAKFPSENPNAVFRVSKEGNILYANRAGQILLSCRKCFDNDKTVSKEWLKLITEAFTSKSEKAFEFECKNRFYSFIIAPVAEGGYANFYGRDITERKQAEDKLLEDQVKLKAMASEMLMTEERERQRLAMGLHDEVCQKLVLAKLTLESSLNLVSDPKVLASLRIVCEGIGETIEQADSLTFELSNPVLRQLGFVIALEKYLTEEIRQKHGIEYELESDEQLGTLQDEIKNCLFRVTRELLTNVVKHAQAHKIRVSAHETQSQIYVRVQDDGVGFKESQAGSKVSQTARFGLFSIREQLEYLGGHLEIESEPGQGTKATVVVPLTKNTIV